MVQQLESDVRGHIKVSFCFIWIVCHDSWSMKWKFIWITLRAKLKTMRQRSIYWLIRLTNWRLSWKCRRKRWKWSKMPKYKNKGNLRRNLRKWRLGNRRNWRGSLSWRGQPTTIGKSLIVASWAIKEVWTNLCRGARRDRTAPTNSNQLHKAISSMGIQTTWVRKATHLRMKLKASTRWTQTCSKANSRESNL